MFHIEIEFPSGHVWRYDKRDGSSTKEECLQVIEEMKLALNLSDKDFRAIRVVPDEED